MKGGQSSVYAVKDVDEALTLLTGVEAGARDGKGQFPEGSVNYKAEDQLLAYAEARKHFSEKEGDDDEE